MIMPPTKCDENVCDRSGRVFERTQCLQFPEGHVVVEMDGLLAGHLLPAPDRDDDVARVELDASRLATRAFGSKQGRARAQKRIEHDGATVGHVLDGVLDHFY